MKRTVVSALSGHSPAKVPMVVAQRQTKISANGKNSNPYFSIPMTVKNGCRATSGGLALGVVGSGLF